MNLIIEIRSKVDGPRAEALATAQTVYSVRGFEVYHDGNITLLDLDVGDPPELIVALFEELVEGLRYHGPCMVCLDVLASNGVELHHRAYGTRQGPGVL